MINPLRSVARKCSLEGLYVCAGRLDIENILKSSLICTVSYLNLGTLGLCRTPRVTASKHENDGASKVSKTKQVEIGQF